MAKKKIKLTRPELKRQRDALARFSRYLPMLKLKQQQLQMTIRQIAKERRALATSTGEAREKFDGYKAVLADVAGVNVTGLAECAEVKTGSTNIIKVHCQKVDNKTQYQKKADCPFRIHHKTILVSCFRKNVFILSRAKRDGANPKLELK